MKEREPVIETFLVIDLLKEEIEACEEILTTWEIPDWQRPWFEEREAMAKRNLKRLEDYNERTRLVS